MFVRKTAVLILLVCGATPLVLAQGLVGDWIGQMNGSFKVRMHFERAGSGFSGKLKSLPNDDTRPWERYFLAYDPAPTLARLTVPVLFLNGSLDVQVRAKENLAAAREALRNNLNATVVELPGMNHLLQDAKTGAPSEYNDIEETMSPAALKLIADWLSRNVLVHPNEAGS